MKTFATFAAAAAAAGLVAVAYGETCDYSVVKPDFHELGSPMATCATATGINFTTGSLLSFSSTEESEICADCTDLVDLIYSFTWYDCEIEIDGVNQTVSSYYETLVGGCSNSTSGSTATATSSSGSVATCDYSVVKPDFHQLGSPMATCTTATGINFTTGSLLSFSSEEESEICAECTELVDVIYSLTWYDCEIAIDGVNQTVKSYYETLVGSCSNSSATTSSSTGSTTTTTSAAGTAVLSSAVALVSAAVFATM